jgi:hypothetical protein
MNSEKTQIARTKVSAPTQFIVDNALVFGDVLHFGEGKAFADTSALDALPNVNYVQPYDPNSPDEWKRNDSVLRGCNYDFSVCNYVLNTLTEIDRRKAFLDAFMSSLYTIFTVRIDKVAGEPLSDGVITKRGTFQTQLTAEEWICWVYDTIRECTTGRYRVKILNKTRNYLMIEVW